jgi:hypothetical protein
MPVPDYRSLVADAAARYPDAWRHAHTNGPRTEEFIRLLARDLHAIDPNVGLNGKRGNPDDISDDALAVFHPEGDVIDRSGRRMAIVDVIVGAGGPNPQPGWASVGGPSPGAWVQPEAVNVPTPHPSPQPQPSCRYQPVDLTRVEEALARAENRLQALIGVVVDMAVKVDRLERSLPDEDVAALVKDVRQTLRNGLGINADISVRTPLGTARGTVTGAAQG